MAIFEMGSSLLGGDTLMDPTAPPFTLDVFYVRQVASPWSLEGPINPWMVGPLASEPLVGFLPELP